MEIGNNNKNNTIYDFYDLHIPGVIKMHHSERGALLTKVHFLVDPVQRGNMNKVKANKVLSYPQAGSHRSLFHCGDYSILVLDESVVHSCTHFTM